MTRDFDALIADIEQEARTEGPRAVRELRQFRGEFGLASQLIASRTERKLSQRGLAALSGVPQSEISRIETGASNPTHATITALLRPLGKRIALVDDRYAASTARASTTPRAKSAHSASRGASGQRTASRKAAPRS